MLILQIKAVYLGRGFYNSDCLGLLHNYAYIMPIVKWGETIQEELSTVWSRVIEHDHARRVSFPVFIDCAYQRGRYDEHGVPRHGYSADALFINTPREARTHHRKRFGIESSYRLAKQSLSLTSFRDAGLRLLLLVASFLLQNVWRYLHWNYVAVHRRGGRCVWNWLFQEFCEMVVCCLDSSWRPQNYPGKSITRRTALPVVCPGLGQLL